MELGLENPSSEISPRESLQRQTSGRRTVLVQAIDEPARKFYEHFGCELSPIHELRLMLLMKDLWKALEGQLGSRVTGGRG